ncbi:MAG: hypothetical protein LBU68_01355 [Rickettsiales bacterium]|jgi:hypothetical protein|nr:hypothetical protein [Rickettsiales bacterium]
MQYKQLFLIILATTLVGCGIVNNVGLIGKNLGRITSGHEYAVEEGKEKEILASGKAIVDMDFGAVGTAWVRVNPDGTIDDKNYTLTYHEIGSIGRRKSVLPPGTYFLNGAVGQSDGNNMLSSTEGMFQSGYYARSIEVENFGWDAEKKQARCFSFTVKAGETLVIPKVKAVRNYLMNSDATICPIFSFVGGAVNDTRFSVGPESRK